MTRSRRNGHNDSIDITVEFGALQQRVSGLETGLRQLGEATSQQLQAMRQETTSQIGGIGSDIDALAAKFDERQKIPWPALMLLLSVITAVGGLAYWPIQQSNARIERQLEVIGDKYVSTKEFEARSSATNARRDDWQANASARIQRNEEALESVRAQIVPRGEHEEKWRGNDMQIVGLQRQIDDQKKAFGDTFSLRDALQQMQKRIDSLEVQTIRKN